MAPLTGGHDSLRYVEMAASVLAGDWLGRYNLMTLINPPLYALFLALNGRWQLPLHLVQQGLYLLAVLTLLLALRSIGYGAGRLAILGLICSLHPVAFYPSTLTYSEALYAPAALAATAAAVALLPPTSRLGPRICWLALLSVSWPVVWHVKGDAHWMIPGLGFLLAVAVYRSRKQPGRRLWAAGLSIPLMTTLALGHWLEEKNLKVYGIEATNELVEPGFVSAMKALIRLEPDSSRPRVPISTKAFERAYELSPDFARLKPYLSKNVGGAGWSAFGCASFGICDDILGGWAVWAVREAAAGARVLPNAVAASDFYGRIGDTLRSACERQEVVCSRAPVVTILTPPLEPGHAAPVIAGAARVLAALAWLDGLEGYLQTLQAGSASAPAVVAKYEVISRSVGSWRYAASGWVNLQVNGLRAVTVAGLCSLLLLAVPSMATRLERFGVCLPGPSPHGGIVLLGLALLVCGRAMLMGFIDALSYPVHVRHLQVAYPMVVTLAVLALPSLRRAHRLQEETTP